MQSKYSFSVYGIIAALAVLLGGCGGAGASSPPPISVTLSKTTATVEIGTSASFTATVSNDAENNGVKWTMSCGIFTPYCGILSSASTATGAPTTFSPGVPQTTNNLTVTLTATSVTDQGKSTSAVITVPAITVS